MKQSYTVQERFSQIFSKTRQLFKEDLAREGFRQTRNVHATKPLKTQKHELLDF